MLFLSTILVAVLACLASATPVDLQGRSRDGGGSLVGTLYQFPNLTWVENLAVRPNDQILVTLITTPQIYQVDPFHPGSAPTLVHTFSGFDSVFGIVQTTPDVYAAIVGKHTAAGGVPGSFTVWQLDYSGGGSSPVITEIAAVPQASWLNGICTVPGAPHVVLLSDFAGGQVFRLDTQSKAVSVAVPSSVSLVRAFNNPNVGDFGANGIHVFNGYLYVANTGSGVFGKIRINPDGTLAPGAAPITLWNVPSGGSLDDFSIDPSGNAYLVTGSSDEVYAVYTNGSSKLLAGTPGSTQIADPTSAYYVSVGYLSGLVVTTNGGLAAPVGGNKIVGGQVLILSL